MTTGVISRALRTLGARDPARERLRKMFFVTTGILLSALWGSGVIHVLHADSGLLAMSVFLSLMSGMFVKDATAPARVATTALLLPVLIVVPVLATLLQSQRVVLLAVFVLISGVAVWIRRFGARATTIGTLSFFAYFFTLFMHPEWKELPAFCLIAVGAAGAQLVMKLIQWFGHHPEHDLGVMLRELRVATAAALETATSPGHERTLPARLDRVDALWRAITGWQSSFRTDAYTSWDAETLSRRILDTCVHTEEACRQLALGHSSAADHDEALSHALATLDERTPTERLTQARDWAHLAVSAFDSPESTSAGHGDLCDYRLAECILAHARLREIDLHIDLHRRSLPGHHPRGDDARADAHPPVAHSSDAATSSPRTPEPRAPRTAGHLQWTPWRDWTPTSRLAIQAMTATALASVVGEAISASRWYWAVLTAFLVFVSTTTRSGILTRAYRRVLGTVLGLAAGIVLTFLAHGTNGVLLAICLLCIMGMIYFAPLNYLYASFFITTMLVALYDLLGVLHGHLLAVRLEETIAGSICGVICAYLLLSTTSKPALITSTDAYLDAVDDLLGNGADLAATPDGGTTLLASVHAVESTQAEVDKTISAMSTAFLFLGRDRVDSARSLMAYSSRSSVRFAQVIMSGAADPAAAEGLTRHHEVIRESVAGAQQAAALVRRRIDPPADNDADPDAPGTTAGTTSTTATPASTTPAVPTETLSPSVGDPTVRAALIALARFTWVMNRLDEILAPSENRRHARVSRHAL